MQESAACAPGVAEFTEVEASSAPYGSREARDAVTDEITLNGGRHREDGAKNLPGGGVPLAAVPVRHRCPGIG